MATKNQKNQSSERISFDEWISDASELLKKGYAITFEMAGLDSEWMRRLYNYNEPPQDIVQWFADKYDLVHVDE